MYGLETLRMLREKIQYLEANQNEQHCINHAYDDFILILHKNINSLLNPRIISHGKRNNKARRFRKPLVDA